MAKAAGLGTEVRMVLANVVKQTVQSPRATPTFRSSSPVLVERSENQPEFLRTWFPNLRPLVL